MSSQLLTAFAAGSLGLLALAALAAWGYVLWRDLRKAPAVAVAPVTLPDQPAQ
jgi:hypothetical protein